MSLAPRISVLCIGLVATAVAAMVPAQEPAPGPSVVADDPDPQATANARDLAARLAASGTPEHTAALRAGLQEVGRLLVTDRGRRSARRARDVLATPAAIRPVVLGIDSDPTYQDWLENQTAIYSLRSIGLPRLFGRSVNGIYIQDDKRFAEVIALVKSRGKTICSGVLVTPRVVLTAAHCVCLKPDRVYLGRTPRSVDDWVTHKRSFAIREWGLPNGLSADGAACRLDTPASAQLHGRDYAVLVLSRSVDESYTQPVVHIADKKDIGRLQKGDKLVVIGFGRNPAFNETSGWKNYVEIPVLSPRCGEDNTAGRYGCRPDRELVSTLGRYDRSPCEGDSGGAAFVYSSRGPGGESARVLVGVVSRGTGYLDDNGHAAEPIWATQDDSRSRSGRARSSRDSTCSGATVYTLLHAGVQQLIAEAASG